LKEKVCFAESRKQKQNMKKVWTKCEEKNIEKMCFSDREIMRTENFLILSNPNTYSRSHLEFPKLEEAISMAAIVIKIKKVVQKMRDP
jgi:hypothetical protein